MKKYLLIIAMFLCLVGCEETPKEDKKEFRVTFISPQGLNIDQGVHALDEQSKYNYIDTRSGGHMDIRLSEGGYLIAPVGWHIELKPIKKAKYEVYQ